jgi:hypothetical protein
MSVFSVIDSLIQYYSSDKCKNDKELISKADASAHMVTVLETVKKALEKVEFKLKAYDMEQKQIEIGHIPCILKGEEEFFLLQPLVQLSMNEIDALVEGLQHMKDVGKFPEDKRVLIVPYEIKYLRAKICTDNEKE